MSWGSEDGGRSFVSVSEMAFVLSGSCVPGVNGSWVEWVFWHQCVSLSIRFFWSPMVGRVTITESLRRRLVLVWILVSWDFRRVFLFWNKPCLTSLQVRIPMGVFIPLNPSFVDFPSTIEILSLFNLVPDRSHGFSWPFSLSILVWRRQVLFVTSDRSFFTGMFPRF